MEKTKKLKVFAALHDDIAEGFVWLSHDFSARTVAKITNAENGRCIYCEALKFEQNFLDRYNQAGRSRVTDPTTSVVMSYWYRTRLGGLETQKEYPLTVAKALPWWGKFRACIGHPQIVVRVAVWLSLLSVGLGAISVAPGAAHSASWLWRKIHPDSGSIPPTRSSALSVAEVLAWRKTYGDLLGKPRDAVIERFGTPQKDEGNRLSWDPSSKTGDRGFFVVFSSREKDGIASGVKVFARTTESLDATELLKKAPLFEFGTGTYTDTLLNYLTVETRDHRNSFQFDVAESGTVFRAMVFTDK